jgi:ferredoxin
MTYVVTDNCQRCRFTDCVTVCPVACFHGDEAMLYIDNEVCIDCGQARVARRQRGTGAESASDRRETGAASDRGGAKSGAGLLTQAEWNRERPRHDG